MHEHASLSTPSPWVARWAGIIPRGGQVLDLACGHGRHARYLAAMGFRVEGVDRDAQALAEVARLGIATLEADLEAGPWPCAGRAFEAIVVCNYLWRPLFPRIFDALAPGGVLIYETFMIGNERYGRPANPAFLLRPGELLELASGRLQVVGFEQGFVSRPKPAVIQCLCAVNGQGEFRIRD
jgi:SAM-dependent methyltransferase